MKTASALLATAAVSTMLPGCASAAGPEPQTKAKLGPFDTNEKPSSYEDITTYNNYYEFGTDKADPAKNAKNFKPKPWTVSVEGMVKKPTVYALDDLIKGLTMEDRIYRHRCVEAWSIVVPWMGFPLAELIKRLEPAPSAKYVVFKTLLDPKQMPEQAQTFFKVLNWPYTEGLRMDEAMNPLTFVAMGIYGKPLPNQNGAPLSLRIPWKYGFKGAKAINKIIFTDKQPLTAWMEAGPNEYGFYSNVNPNVDHPRWSQKTERRLGEFYKRPTLMFNGYSDQVASLYTGMDLRKNF
jgi:sulfoxide reductase catalytic subunit YedY